MASQDSIPRPRPWPEESAKSRAERPPADVLEAARFLVGSADLVEMTPTVLARALDQFPVRVGTLDARHLATAAYLAAQGMRFQLATYDTRLAEAARSIGLDVVAP